MSTTDHDIRFYGRDGSRRGQQLGTQLKIIGMEPMIYRRSWPIEAMMGMR